MLKISTACLLAALATVSLGASAAAPRAGNDRIAALDTDGDGFVSRDEAATNPKLSGSFDAIDTDRDGKLSPSELKGYAKAHKAEKADKASKGLGKLDTNRDGMVTRDEAAANKRLLRNFDTIDINKDGRLSADELKAAKASSKAGPPAMPPVPAPAT